MNRRHLHLLVLAALFTLPVVAGLTESTRPDRGLLRAGPPAASAAQSSLAVAERGDGQASAPLPTQTPVVAQRPPTLWLQNHRSSTIWTGEQADAAGVGPLAQWSALRQLGAQRLGRIPVESTGDGASQLPMRGWINAEDVGPAGSPSTEHFLSTGPGSPAQNGAVSPRRVVPAWPQNVSATYGAIVDGDSGQLLWGRNAHGEVAPASLTKIATALVALERTSLTDRVNVTVDSRQMVESTVMGLEPGENLSMETLLYGMMLWSGNDAALQIALKVAGTEERFADLMNAKTAQLGLVNSRWVNSHGLDLDGHYSSPFDLCQLARVGMRDPIFFKLASTRRWEAEGYVILNRNRLLLTYPKADGVKIGYTDAAGRAIVGSAVQDGHRVFVALLRSWDPVGEAQALLEYAFHGFSWT